MEYGIDENMYIVAERSVYPVGHGGFHGEKIGEDFHFIFDCGSKNQKNLNDLIEKNYKDITEIDLLVISHFHEDHYNGLSKLSEGRRIKKI
ncbi:MAG: MBL fold metallo-hydrolase [Cetobacterium sp.]